MFIKDNESNEVRKYGTDAHDSLIVSQNGTYLTYYNLQNGDGSLGGGYSFTDENGHIPNEIENWEGLPFFNIGGFSSDDLKEENERLKDEFVALALDREDDVRMAIYKHGYDTAVCEMLGAIERCKAWMREKDESKVPAIETMQEIIMQGLQGTYSPRRDTKTDEG